MPWNNPRFIGQREQAGMNRFDDLLAVAARQIGAADAPGKERISGDQHLERSEVQTHGALRVARRMDHRSGVAGEAYRLAVDQALVGRRGVRWGGQAEPSGLLVHHGEQGQIVFVEQNRRAGKAL